MSEPNANYDNPERQMPFLSRMEERGIERGTRQILKSSIINLLQVRFEAVPPELIEAINSIEDIAELQRLLLETVSVNSVADFEQLLSQNPNNQQGRLGFTFVQSNLQFCQQDFYKKENLLAMSETKDKVIDLTFQDNHYRLSRLDDEQYYEKWQNSLKIQDDWQFYMSFYSSLERQGEYLNLAKIYVTLRSLCGESGRFFDDWKGSFSFPFGLEVIKLEKTFNYLLDIYDFRGTVEFSIRRCIHSGETYDKYEKRVIQQPFASEFNRDEINAFITLFYGYLIGYFSAIENNTHESFVKRVDSNLILYGYQQGNFFEEHFNSQEAYKEAIKLKTGGDKV